MCGAIDPLYTVRHQIDQMRDEYHSTVKYQPNQIEFQERFKKLQSKALCLFLLRGPEEFHWIAGRVNW